MATETETNDASRGIATPRPYTFLDYVSFLITNAEYAPDPRMNGATDCYIVSLDDMTEVENRITQAQIDRETTQTRIADLHKALRKFGSHLKSCHINNTPRSGRPINKCDCGFNDALGGKS